MNYRAFIHRIMHDTGLLREDAEVAAKLTFNTVKRILLEGEEVHIPKLGVLHLHTTEPKGDFIHPGNGAAYKRKQLVKLKLRSSRKFEKILTNQLLGEGPDTKSMTESELDNFLGED